MIFFFTTEVVGILIGFEGRGRLSVFKRACGDRQNCDFEYSKKEKEINSRDLCMI